MKTEKRGNNYRIRKTINGETYRISFDHQPTDEEVIKALSRKLDNSKDKETKNSVKYYADKYIKKKRDENRSPTTLNAYNSIITNTPEWFLKTSLSSVDSDILKKVIDEYSTTTNSRKTQRSVKTIGNFKGFYMSVLSEYRPNTTIKVKLPTKIKQKDYEPTTKDVRTILEYVQGSEYELFLKLSSIGLRRGEVGAITVNDLDKDNVLTINKDMVRDENGEFYIKEHPKTSASYRRIRISDDIADMLREKEVACTFNLDTINKYLTRTLKKLDIPHFRLHILRHFASAYLVKNGFTKDQVCDYMGWERGSNVMERVYSYNLDPHEVQKPIADAFNGLF